MRCLALKAVGHSSKPRMSPRSPLFRVPFSKFYLPLTLEHLLRHSSRKISKLKAISIKLTPIRLRYFCLVTACARMNATPYRR
jgi:hypothetical protein